MRGYKAYVAEPISQTPIIINNLQRLKKLEKSIAYDIHWRQEWQSCLGLYLLEPHILSFLHDVFCDNRRNTAIVRMYLPRMMSLVTTRPRPLSITRVYQNDHQYDSFQANCNQEFGRAVSVHSSVGGFLPTYRISYATSWLCFYVLVLCPSPLLLTEQN